MRIEYLQISNILSFKYVSDITQAEKVVFDDGLNIIIGENGSGKSNGSGGNKLPVSSRALTANLVSIEIFSRVVAQ